MNTDHTVRELNEEWARLEESSAASIAAWAAAEPQLGGIEHLGDLLTAIRCDPDQALAALLRLGDADRLAWRVVLQAMLGKMVRLAAATRTPVAEAVAELWVAIGDYPLQRRPRSIASNLAWTVHRRLRASTGVVLADLSMMPAADAGPSAVDTLAQARRLGLIDAGTHRLLWLVYVLGVSSTDAAEELGTTPTTVRWRCSRELRRLSDRAVLLAS